MKNNAKNNNLKSQNSREALYYILRENNITRNILSQKTGLSLPTITRAVTDLLEGGYIHEVSSAPEEKHRKAAGAGRKTCFLNIAAQSCYSFGIHIDKNNYKVGITDLSGKVIAFKSINCNCNVLSAKSVLQEAKNNLYELAAKHKIDTAKVKSLGIALPGVVNSSDGVLLFSPQLSWQGLPIRTIADNVFDNALCVTVENDVKSFAYGETFKGVKGSPQSVVFLNIGSGVGSAYIENGKIFNGNFNCAGEIGHAKIDIGGILCDCGRTGCLQTHMTEKAIVDKAKKFLPHVASSQEVIESMKDGQEWASLIINELVNYSTIAIGLLVSAYDPQTVVLCGDLIEKDEIIFEKILNRHLDTEYTPFNNSCNVIRSCTNETGVFYGVCILATEKFFVAISS